MKKKKSSMFQRFIPLWNKFRERCLLWHRTANLSVTLKLVVVVVFFFLVTAFTVWKVVHHQLIDVIDSSQSTVYVDKIDAMMNLLDRKAEQLDAAEQPGAREAETQKAALDTLRQRLYKSRDTNVIPFILNKSGQMLLPPDAATNKDDRPISGQIQKMLVLKNGEIQFTDEDGNGKWCIFRYFQPWDWLVGYDVPLSIKYADAGLYERTLLQVMIGVTVIAVILISLIVSRAVRPIITLTHAATRMAGGDLAPPIHIHRKDELGTLARSFVHMRDAIREKMADLAEKNQELRHEIAQRKRVEEMMDNFFNLSIDMLCVANLDGSFRRINPAFERKLGNWAKGRLPKSYIDNIHPEDKDATLKTIAQLARGEAVVNFQNRYRFEDGTYKWLEWTAAPDPATELFYAVGRDVTREKQAEAERSRLQTRLLQSQKMEAIGTLAGGIAHDFNNLLMGILGNVSLMISQLESGHPFHAKLRQIESHVENATDLTRQLLGFAREGKYEVMPMDLNRVIRKSAKMFGRTKKEIDIHLDLENSLWTVEADGSQIDHVLLNLYVNAWQAMPEGGDLYIGSENIQLEEMEVLADKIKPGKYVKISVTDTGMGMGAETRERIFEPFFTTKRMGRGTGLGLASVYGIVKNHGGIINVDSEEGEGSTFSIYLPASKKAAVEKKTASGAHLLGSETVLLVDDEEMIIDVGSQMLEKLGYRTLTAIGGDEAVKVFREKCDEVHLVILDMIMPHLSGKETYEALKKIRKDVKVILSSGYSLNGKAEEIMKQGCNGFIQKPFNLNGLSMKIREVLE